MLSRLPEGRLMISTDGNELCFFDVSVGDGGRKLRQIGKDRQRVQKLARRRFLEEELKRLDRNIPIVEKARNASVSLDQKDILSMMPKHFDLFEPELLIYGREAPKWPCPSRDPLILPKAPLLDLGGRDPAEWAAEPYRENTSYLQFKTHLAPRGFYCRSKSELGIYSIYDRKRIYYHPDETIIINGTLLSPDAIGARQNGDLIYHEHCGVQSARYSERLHNKLYLYEQAGIVPGKNLLLTFDDENGNLNLALVEAMIDDIYRLV